MKNIGTLFFVACCTLLFSSCGSIYSAVHHGMRPVYLVDAPKDIEVSVNGVKQKITEDMVMTYEQKGLGTHRYGTDFSTRSIRLHYKHDATIDIYSPSQNKKATILLKSKGSGAYITTDIIFTGCIGLLVDIPTKNYKVLKPRLVDVKSALDGKPINKWRSKSKLKRYIIKNEKRTYYSHN